MIVYKPISKLFRNRMEAKLALGHNRFNRLWKTERDNFIINNDNSLAKYYEYFYTNPIQPNKDKE